MFKRLIMKFFFHGVSHKKLKARTAPKVLNLVSTKFSDRQNALEHFYKPGVLFHEDQQSLNCDSVFIVLEELSNLCLIKGLPFFPEVAELLFVIMDSDSYDLRHNDELIKEILKRKIQPFRDKIQELGKQYPPELIVESKVILYWLNIPVEKWDHYGPAVTAKALKAAPLRRLEAER